MLPSIAAEVVLDTSSAVANHAAPATLCVPALDVVIACCSGRCSLASAYERTNFQTPCQLPLANANVSCQLQRCTAALGKTAGSLVMGVTENARRECYVVCGKW